MPSPYSERKRRDVLGKLRAGASVRAVAREHGISETTLRRWRGRTPPPESSASVRYRLVHGTLTAEQELAIGRGIAKLLLESSSWVHRRVELIRCLDDENVERQMSVDFTLPVQGSRSVSEMVALVGPLVPLTTLTKETLQRFSLWDEEGNTMPMLSSPESGRVAGACLVFLATSALRRTRPEIELPSELKRKLRLVGELAPDKATALLKGLRKASGKPDDMPPDATQEQRACAAAARADPELASVMEIVFADATFNGIATELAEQFIMTIPLRDEASARRVIKFTYEQRIVSTRERNSLRYEARRALESLGWISREITFGRFPLGHTGSYHVEVEAPEQIEFECAQLAAFDVETEQGATQVIEHSDVRGDRVHLYRRDCTRATLGTATVRLRAQLVGLPLGAPALAVLTAAALLVGSARSTELNTEAGAALLLIGPALLATLLARPGEHAMVTQLLLGTRLLVFLTGLVSFAAAGSLAADYDDDTLPGIWCVLTALSCILAALLTLGLVVRCVGPSVRGR